MTGVYLASEKKLDYYDVVEATKKCLEQVNAGHVEIFVTPLRTGYRVEVYPQLTRQLLETLVCCVSKLLEASAEIREHPYGTTLVIKR